MMRTDKDSLGPVQLPAHALYSAGTARGATNFAGMGRAIADYPQDVGALARLKKAAALANAACGGLAGDVAAAIVRACDEIAGGQHHEAFIIPVAEGSGGTSTNMNFNEVIANRAGQILGDELGHFVRVHPNDHVNLGQSTNDVVPSTVKLACALASADLVAAARALAGAFRDRAEANRDVLRVGRTCMHAAQPMTYGQLFDGYAAIIDRSAEAVAAQARGLTVVPMGGTAIGTGLGTLPDCRDRIAGEMTAVFGFPVTLPADPFDAMQAADGFVRFSAELKILGEALGKIAADLVILSSDSGAGIGEIRLPAVQPGSSIMAGKVNPVIPMMVQQAAFLVHGLDATVSVAALHGQMEINPFEPIIAQALFDSIAAFVAACTAFRLRCIDGLTVDAQRSQENLIRSSAISSVFLHRYGYERVTGLVKAGQQSGRGLVQEAVAQGLLAEGDIRVLLATAASGTSI